MPKRITNIKVVVHRNGKRVAIPANTMFDFTTDELQELKDSRLDAVRTPRNEVESVAELKVATDDKKSTAKGAAKTGTDSEL